MHEVRNRQSQRRDAAAPYGLAAWLLLLSFATAFNLRPSMAAIGPLLPAMQKEIDISHAMAGLLTTLPTLCMGVFAFAGHRVVRFFGLRGGIIGGLILIGGADALRAFAGAPAGFLATATMAGIGIAIIQVLLPTFLKTQFPRHTAAVTGLYTVGLMFGASATAALAAPMSNGLHSWRLALAVWAVPSFVCVPLWSSVQVGHQDMPDQQASALGGEPWRSAMVWLLALYLGGCGGIYGVALAWTAAVYQDLGFDSAKAGWLLATVTLAMTIGGVAIPLAMQKGMSRRFALAIALVCSLVGLFGIAIVPTAAAWIWVLLLGFGNGALFPLTLILPLDHCDRTGAIASRVLSFVLGVGYLIAALFPWAMGELRDAVGDYRDGLIGLFCITVAMAAIIPIVAPKRAVQRRGGCRCVSAPRAIHHNGRKHHAGRG